MIDNRPPRKGCTAWEAETGTDGHDTDSPFVVLTLHHGLGKMTRVDLAADDARDLAALLIAEATEAERSAS